MTRQNVDGARGWGPAGAQPHQGGWLSGPVIDEYSGGSVSRRAPGVAGAAPQFGVLNAASMDPCDLRQVRARRAV